MSNVTPELEKVAAAIKSIRHDLHLIFRSLDDLPESAPHAVDYRIARAALSAIREPTERMIEAFGQAQYADNHFRHDPSAFEIKGAFTAAIDAALGEDKAP
jgi:hypothetical protein